MSEAIGVVLAAGKGTRMKSTTPKVLHRIAGRPMIHWAVDAVLDAGASHAVVVVGYAREAVEAALRARFGDRVVFAVQDDPRGTGHAVRCAVEAPDSGLADHDGPVLITMGDCPCVRPETLRALLEATGPRRFGMMSSRLDDPAGYGRLLRDAEGSVVAIREHKDCSAEERAVNDVNPGLYVVRGDFLRQALGELRDDNAQGELYLTDLASAAAAAALAPEDRVVDLPGDLGELLGVNDRHQLATVRGVLQARINEALGRGGVGIVDPAVTYIDADCEVAPDATLAPGVHLRGRCRIGPGAMIDVGCVLDNVDVAAGAYLKPYTVASESVIGPEAKVGPFAHLRPGSELGPKVKVGNFCETKKTRIGEGSSIGHLAYVGDGEIGEGVNVGAGVIFCNYDGYRKHVTTLEDGAFIGSDSQLVAPVTVGKGAYVASGSTVTRDVPPDGLALSRAKQVNKEGYASRLKARLKPKG
ncbi:MAG: bifunctional UDP-N-acetylglucosamine diphosphorylase/glucosamine-1-phosphate N-acetyltransferase GlmU [Myxococcota bacterium]